MASPGGSSLSYWRLLIQLRNYLSKSYPSIATESVQKDIANILKLYSNECHEEKVNNAQKPRSQQLNTRNALEKDKIDNVDNMSSIITEPKTSYNEIKKAFNLLNAYLPHIPQVGLNLKSNDQHATDLVPKWTLKKRDSVSKSSVDSRTRHLVRGLESGLSDHINLRRTEELCTHLKTYPDTRGAAVKCFGVSKLLNIIHKSKDLDLQATVREALALIGYIHPVSGHGIRILSIDGGGTRGLVALEVLHHLELRTGKPIHELFDFVCGVSTGAVIAVLIGAHRLPLTGVTELYRKISTKVFSQTKIKGTASLVWNNSFYDSDVWTNILKENMGDVSMIETARDPNITKLCLVSTQANANWIKAFLFRNYNFPYRTASHFNGSSSCKMWEGARASAAAPGYFSEFRLEDLILLDGGVMVNNPTSIAIHEARQLWPDNPIQCVVSVGTGRHEPLALAVDKNINWALRLKTIINSATDTEGVHTTLHDLLPGNTYFRLNPYLSEDIMLDEIREEKLATMIEDTHLYLRKNETKINEAVLSLMKPKNFVDKVRDEIHFKRLLWNI